MAKLGKTVLHVDDSPQIRELVSRSLSKEPLSLIQASNGLEALEALERQEVHLVLLDMIMPKMDGWETIRKIRSDDRFSTLPIVAISSVKSNFDKEKAILNGANEYIEKPFEIKSLRLVCQKYLEKED